MEQHRTLQPRVAAPHRAPSGFRRLARFAAPAAAWAASLMIAGAIASLPRLAHAGDWQLAQDENGVAVYTRASEGSDNLAFRGTVTVPQSFAEIEAVLQDTQGYPGWYARCESAVTVERHIPDWRIVHLKIDLPFPVSDRDAVVRVDREPAGERLVLRLSTAADALPREPGYIRMTRVDGAWTLEPDPAGGTRVTLEQHNDPGGSLPTWLSNLLVTDQPATTLAGLRRTLASRAAQVKPASDPAALPKQPASK